jgi:hypothetical protein
VLAVTLAASLALLLGGGVAKAAEGTIACSLSVTDSSGLAIDTITANTQVVLTATAARGTVAADDVAVFVDAASGLDVTGEPVATSSDGSQTTWTLRTRSLIAGDHSLYFEFISADGADYCITDTSALHVGELEPTHTTTSVNLSSATIESGDSIDITASVVQEGTQIAPPGGNVTFWSKREGASAFIQIGGSQPLVDGQASVHDVGGWTAGRYTIEARYAGDTFQFAASQGDAALSAHGTSILSVDPSDSVVVGDSATLSGKLTNHELQPSSGRTVSFTIAATGDTCSATTGGDGVASCTVVVHGPAGNSAVNASFAGDDLYGAATATGTITITRSPTTLAVAHASATSGSSTALSATLTTDGGTPLGGQAVTLSIAGHPSESCTGTTTPAGVATCSVPIAEPAGTYVVNGSFAGTTTAYLPSSGSNGIDVVPAPTTLTYTGSSYALPGVSATISFVLKSGTTPVASRPVTITFDGQPYSTTTDATGTASVVIASPVGTSAHTATAAFAGDPYFGPSTKTQSVPSGIVTSLQYLGDTTASSGGTAQLKVKLLDAQHNTPLPTANVVLTLATGETCTATTDANGIGSCGVVVNAGAGPDTITATYAGLGPYLPSSTTATLVVATQRTAIVLAPVSPVLRGSSVHLSAFLVSLQTLHPLAGKTVTLSFGSQSCTATTSFFGFADCTINSVTAPVGLTTVTATFAGDAQAQGSSASWQAIVYALAPGNCWFVVGDRDSDGHVNFWGSQWSRNNPLSRGSGPSSFKGYSGATGSSLHAGSTWSARTGNSSSPPSGPLPEYMAVIVSSSIKQSGSTISGDVAKIVIVKTDSGYDANPGHAGTGTVVATLP